MHQHIQNQHLTAQFLIVFAFLIIAIIFCTYKSSSPPQNTNKNYKFNHKYLKTITPITKNIIEYIHQHKSLPEYCTTSTAHYLIKYNIVHHNPQDNTYTLNNGVWDFIYPNTQKQHHEQYNPKEKYTHNKYEHKNQQNNHKEYLRNQYNKQKEYVELLEHEIQEIQQHINTLNDQLKNKYTILNYENEELRRRYKHYQYSNPNYNHTYDEQAHPQHDQSSFQHPSLAFFNIYHPNKKSVRNAYLKMCKQFHPDVVPQSERANATQKIQEINMHYEKLCAYYRWQ